MPIITIPGAVNPPPPVSMASPDGILTATMDARNAGVLLEAQFAAGVWPNEVHKVRFLRGDIPVRSGDPAWAPGGWAVAYDHEAPLHVPSAWSAVAYDYHGREIARSQGVALAPQVEWETGDGLRDAWIKSIANPGLSMQLPVCNDPEWSDDDGFSPVGVPGRSLYAGSWDVPNEEGAEFVFHTSTRAERDRLIELLRSGPFLLQTNPVAGEPDRYVISRGRQTAYLVGGYDPQRHTTTRLTPTRRPATASSPLFVPGASYDETGQLAPTYDMSSALWPAYRDIVQPRTA